MGLYDPDKFWGELEAAGEDEVRRKLAANAYSLIKVPHVQAWLRTKEEERGQQRFDREERRREAELGVLRSTKNAAWVAAAAALVSMLFAAIAILRS